MGNHPQLSRIDDFDRRTVRRLHEIEWYHFSDSDEYKALQRLNHYYVSVSACTQILQVYSTHALTARM